MNQDLVLKIIGMITIPFLFVVLIIPLIKKIAIDIKAVDIPGGRHIHKKITPKLGGDTPNNTNTNKAEQIVEPTKIQIGKNKVQTKPTPNQKVIHTKKK